jgi:hypothetical protein
MPADADHQFHHNKAATLMKIPDGAGKPWGSALEAFCNG